MLSMAEVSLLTSPPTLILALVSPFSACSPVPLRYYPPARLSLLCHRPRPPHPHPCQIPRGEPPFSSASSLPPLSSSSLPPLSSSSPLHSSSSRPAASSRAPASSRSPASSCVELPLSPSSPPPHLPQSRHSAHPAPCQFSSLSSSSSPPLSSSSLLHSASRRPLASS